MPEDGDNVVLLGTEGEPTALSDTLPNQNEAAVLHTEGAGRGASTVTDGDDVVLLRDDTAQGPGAGKGLQFGDVQANDKLLVAGDKARVFVPVTNNNDTSQDVTVQFTENTKDYDTVTKTVASGDTVAFGVNPTKSSAGVFTYSVVRSDTQATVTWFQGIDPRYLTADPVLLSPGSTTTITQVVGNRGDGDLDAEVSLRESGSVFYTETVTVSPGNTVSVSANRTKSVETSREYTATVEEVATGLQGTSNPTEVFWTDDAKQIDLSPNDDSTKGYPIDDGIMTAGPETFFFGDGKIFEAGTYVLEVSGSYWSHQDANLDPAGGKFDFYPPESRYEDQGDNPDEPYAIYTGSTVIFGPAIIYPNGPFNTGGGEGTYQADIWGNVSTTSARGTFELTTSGKIGFFNMDTQGDYSDNAASMSYSLYRVPSNL